MASSKFICIDAELHPVFYKYTKSLKTNVGIWSEVCQRHFILFHKDTKSRGQFANKYTRIALGKYCLDTRIKTFALKKSCIKTSLLGANS